MAIDINLKDHSSTQHRCGICSKQFSRAAILRDHIRRHEKEKPFQCGTCDKAFASKSDLKRHEDSHAGRKFACTKCGRQFTRRLAITKHICTQSISNAAYDTVTHSIETDLSLQYIQPSNTQSNITTYSSGPSQHGICSEGTCPTHSVHASSRRDGPFPDPLSIQHTPENYALFSGADEDEHEFSDASSDSEMSSDASDRTDTEPLPDWEEYAYQCGICPAQYEYNIPFARHLVHHLEELDLRPYRCNTCKISFAFQEELAKHEIYDQKEQREEAWLSLPCIWNCGKVFTTADACRDHLGAMIDARCKVGMALEGHSRITVLQHFKELLAPEATRLLQAMQRLIDSSLNGYKPRSLDMVWFHKIISELDTE